MHSNRGRQPLTLALIVGALGLGMVLGGTVDLTPVSYAAPDPALAQSVRASTPESFGLPSLADLAEAVSPAVVSIQVTTFESGRRGPQDLMDLFGPRGRRPQEEGEGRRQRRSSAGSGFVISPDGLIVTNHHVIEGAAEVMVHLGDRDYQAEVKGIDAATDLALLEIDAEVDLPYLALGSSESLRVGDWVMVIGSPLRLENSVSVGVVSAKGRGIGITQDSGLENFIQTDAAINFGNSGGPLVDLQGRVVGIATAINVGAENIGFAVPVRTLEQVLPQLRETGSVRRGFLGVDIENLTFEDAAGFGLDSPDGALINGVRSKSPAQDAGLKHGDIILSVDGESISNTRELIQLISARPPGEDVRLELFRNGSKIRKSVRLGERPGPDGEAVPVIEEQEEEEEGEGSIEWLGIEYKDITSSFRENHSLDDAIQGVMITDISVESPLNADGVVRGRLTIISEVNGQPVSNSRELKEAVDKLESGDWLRLYLRTPLNEAGEFRSWFATVKVP